MKHLLAKLVIACASLFMVACATPGKNGAPLKKEKLGNLDDVYVYDNVYIAGQPDAETVKTLKEQGFSTIISLRDPKETPKMMSSKKMAEDAGLEFHQVPLPKEGQITDNWVEKVNSIVESNKGKKVLLHCQEGDRAKTWIGANLYKSKKMSAEEAVKTTESLDLVNPYWIKSLRKYTSPEGDY